jgi:hypothetical protein
VKRPYLTMTIDLRHQSVDEALAIHAPVQPSQGTASNVVPFPATRRGREADRLISDLPAGGPGDGTGTPRRF